MENNYSFRSLTDPELQELRGLLPITNIKVTRSRKSATLGRLSFMPVESDWTIEEFSKITIFLEEHNLGIEREEPSIKISEYIDSEFKSGIDGILHYTLTENAELQQLKYIPKSKGKPIGTLVSPKLRDAIADSLEQLSQRVGNLDRYVAKNLGYSQKELFDYFSAEQIDAIALAIFNIQRNKGLILGDQTGIGKGRVVAAVIKYALINDFVPIFVTDNEKLYIDIMRDLRDIGIGASFKPFVTNANTSITMEDGTIIESDPDLATRLVSRDISGYDAIFTTYYQMSTVNGKFVDRHDFLTYFASRSIICFDESHQAGVSTNIKTCSARGHFAQELAARAAGVLYSSATFAKTPEAITFYNRTDIANAVDGDYSTFVLTLESKGLAMQQVLATDLARAGQYIRRERSYAGIEFNTVLQEVDKKLYNKICSILAKILDFDENYKKPALERIEKPLKREAKKIKLDTSIGDAGAISVSFVAIMHNLIDQMLLSIKCDAAITQAIAAHERGEKPIIVLSNTMGAAIERYAETMGLNPGDIMNFSFADILLRYLDRSREILVTDADNQVSKEILGAKELTEDGIIFYNEIRELITELDSSSLPASPIDYIIYRLRIAGLSVAEITGRQHTVVYQDKGMFYKVRTTKERSKETAVEIVRGVNSGKIDCLIISRPGLTGLSIHASENFSDQKIRHMIILQADKDINLFMQTLGRVNRTGQVKLPIYTLLVADIPAEKRPASVLCKKLYSLNANTTGRRESPAVSISGACDFMNKYGNYVAYHLMMEYPNINAQLANPVRSDDDFNNAILRVTGRSVFLPIEKQEWLYNTLAERYNDLVDNEELTGVTGIKVQTISGKLIGEPLQLIEPSGSYDDFPTPFNSGVSVQEIEINKIFKPFSQSEVLKFLDADSPENAIALGVEKRDQIIADFENSVAIYEDNYRPPNKEDRDPELIDQIISRRKSQWEIMRKGIYEIIEMFPPGQAIRLVAETGGMSGVVGQIHPPSAGSNPSSPSAWRIRLYLTSRRKQIVIPFSSLLSISPKFTLRVIDDGQIWNDFNQSRRLFKEKRQICYGNILRACHDFGGQIVEFYDDKGKNRYGVLTPADFSTREYLENSPVEINNVDHAIAYFENVTKFQGVLNSRDGHLKVIMCEDYRTRTPFLILETPKVKKTGGKYYLNENITAAAKQDFESVGRIMRLKINNKNNIKKTLDVLTKIGLFSKSYIQESRELVGSKKK